VSAISQPEADVRASQPDAAARASEPEPDAPPPDDGPSTQPGSGDSRRSLASLLAMAFGGVEAARAAVAQALARTGRRELPATGPELLAFVQAHLLTPLSDEIGPRLTLALVDDLVALLDPGAVPVPRAPADPPAHAPGSATRPGSWPRVRGIRLAVLLVDPDRVGRAELARALLRAGWNVTLVDTVADLGVALQDEAPVDAVLVDASHFAAQAILAELVRRRPHVALVARSVDAARTRALLGPLGLTRLSVCPRGAPAGTLIDALKRAARG
jgi:hypothetical protein